MNRLVHFEIHAEDPARAAAFYRTIFGWEIRRWEATEAEYWMIYTGPASGSDATMSGGLLRRKGGAPAQGQAVNAFVCTIRVEDVDILGAAIVAAGGSVAMPKFAAAGIGWHAYYKDTEGNIFGIYQHDPTAQAPKN